MKSVVLVGFMGAGKTETGRVLSARLGVPLIDLDKEIERIEGKTVARIFSELGEGHFRRLEREVLQNLREGNRVLAVGGGAFTTDDNIALINTIADSVWLDCPLPVCLERCARRGSSSCWVSSPNPELQSPSLAPFFQVRYIWICCRRRS
jgi:shikimate kinase